ncbi:DUF5082 family protein [Fictibacillus aquaticus]|uniref:Uncharacterized protein n=1 Tax=Fictibacillus aquaticus TaxID=2021314 RepID=A0A235F5M9_9BACL|nr:DUF5082 family protein [Fictibacillus aquaticus]OYD56549.1 hypothetical protein CGZ90_16180 [Fictibacillus aquaticus]
MDTLSSLYALLRKKQEHLIRLNNCQSELAECQSDFQRNQHLCTKPELSAMTWEGVLAKQFDNLRENGILSAYEEIQGSQFQTVFSAIDTKKSQLHEEIRSIQESISALQLAELQNSDNR